VQQIADNYVLGAGQTAQIVGHLSADAAATRLMVDVTPFVRSSVDRRISFLIVREVRFDGDVDDVNYLRVASKEDGTAAGPALILYGSLTSRARGGFRR